MPTSDQNNFDMMQPAMLILYILLFILCLQVVFYFVTRRAATYRKQKLFQPKKEQRQDIDVERGQKFVRLQKSDSETTLRPPPVAYSKETERIMSRLEKSLDRQELSRSETANRKYHKPVTPKPPSRSLPRTNAGSRPNYSSLDRYESRRPGRKQAERVDEEDTSGPFAPPRAHTGSTYSSLSVRSNTTESEMPSLLDRVIPDSGSLPRAERLERLKKQQVLPFSSVSADQNYGATVPSLARKGMLDVLKNRTEQAPAPPKEEDLYPAYSTQETIPSLARTGMLDILKRRAE